MKTMAKLIVLLVMVFGLAALTMASTASAREVITVNKANGGNFMVMAWDNRAKTFYYISGTLTSDSHKITVPRGYGSTINVSLGRRVGSRNMYDKRDPFYPIFEMKKKSRSVLEFIYKGHGSGSVSLSAPPNAAFDVFGGGSVEKPERKPPTGAQ